MMSPQYISHDCANTPQMDTRTTKSELTLTAIVETALEMAAASGLESVSLGEVAKRLGISKSGVFSRVGSREALQEAVLDEHDRRFVAEVFMPALAHPRGLPRLNAIVKNWIDSTAKDTYNGCLYMAGAFEYDDLEGTMHDRVQQNVIRMRDMLCRTVKQALDAGHLRPDTDPEQMAFEIYSLMVGLMHDARFLRDPKAQDRVRNAYDRLISTYCSFSFNA
jgi:AcrR family transcriptional regulator